MSSKEKVKDLLKNEKKPLVITIALLTISWGAFPFIYKLVKHYLDSKKKNNGS